ncbi:Alpha/Beta hydrolase protein, partial [Rhodocollybia butyracea]
SVRYLTSDISISQMQSLSKSGVVVYQEWANAMGIDSKIEELGKEAKLLWVGPQSADRIVLYIPGGGYVNPITDYMIQFFHRIQQETNKKMKGEEIAVVVLDYSQFPSTFPTQLIQLISAVERLFTAGVKPSGLTLIGDSAGANIILQFLSHTLHPIPEIPPSPLSTRDTMNSLQGVCLISPWVGLNEATPSHFQNDAYDILASRTLLYWGSAYVAKVPGFMHHYIKVSCAPKNWFDGIGKLVNRVLITAGGSEVLLDDAVNLKETLAKVHPDVNIDIEVGAVHDEPILDSGANVKTLGRVAYVMIDWL